MLNRDKRLSWTLLFSMTLLAATACDSSKPVPLQFDGGTIILDLSSGNDSATRGDSGGQHDAEVAPCIGGTCDWCAQDQCPLLCTAGHCNDWAPDPQDRDGDGHPDSTDNCPLRANAGQANSDTDRIGDLCDLCPQVDDPQQLDADGDGLGDACDLDADNDGVLNEEDNCPLTPNPLQSNHDDDSLGDACDLDADSDGVLNEEDNCPLVSNPAQSSSDPNTFGEDCDTDSDMDNIMDSQDNCPMVTNQDQGDQDGDLVGDVCDIDLDGDGVFNARDNCTSVANQDQLDSDRDGMGDACDLAFCFVVHGPDGTTYPMECLDPKEIFRVFSPTQNVRTGLPVVLPLYINRSGLKISYSWEVVNRPAGSLAAVIGAGGECTATTLFACTYPESAPAGFVPDLPGVYTVRVIAMLAGPDPVNPAWPKEATYETTITAEGQTSGTICIPAKCYD